MSKAASCNHKLQYASTDTWQGGAPKFEKQLRYSSDLCVGNFVALAASVTPADRMIPVIDEFSIPGLTIYALPTTNIVQGPRRASSQAEFCMDRINAIQSAFVKTIKSIEL